MRLVDTSAWIEWLTASATGKSLEVAMPAWADWLVPTIVQLELAKWLAREVGEDKADQVVSSRRPMPSCTPRPWNMKPTF
jgi:hypothetical protein